MDKRPTRLSPDLPLAEATGFVLAIAISRDSNPGWNMPRISLPEPQSTHQFGFAPSLKGTEPHQWSRPGKSLGG